MTTYLSNAFLQQCFSIHRYDLVVRRLTRTGVAVSCRQCRIRHIVRLEPWGDHGGDIPAELASAGTGPLVECATRHLQAVSIRDVDVQQERMNLSCRECRTDAPFYMAECVTKEIQSSLP